ncbi:MAG: hypothetical protein AAFV80_08545 [Bacteroidota bacterium]
MKKWIILLALCLKAFGAQASIELSDEIQSVGQEVTITCSEAVDSLAVAYRPGSAIVETVFLVNNPPATTFKWVPEQAGVVALSYTVGSGSSVSKNVSVRYAGLSYSGILVMLAAGTILFGGATVAFRTLFQDEAEDGTMDLDPTQLPDT